MKKLLLILLSITLFTSCKLKEEITFNEDGTGTYNLVIDMSRLMAMGKDLGKASDSIKVKKEPKIKDSVIRLGDLLKDKKDKIDKMSKQRRKALKKLKDLQIRMHLDEVEGEMNIGYLYEFKNADALNNLVNNLETINKIQKEDSLSPLGDITSAIPKSRVTYKFSKHEFMRIATASETDKKKDNEKEDDKALEQMANMFQFELVYHFPRRIKSVSYKDALLSADGKTLHINVPINKLDNPEFTNLKVTFD